jgi:hypothetical protein
MGRPKTPWLVARGALLALARGATIGEAAELFGLGTRTVDALISEHGRMSHVATYRPRRGVLTCEVIHSLLDIMYAGALYTTISRAVHIHPTVAELVPTTLPDLRPLEER